MQRISYRFSHKKVAFLRVWDNLVFGKHIWDIRTNLKPRYVGKNEEAILRVIQECKSSIYLLQHQQIRILFDLINDSKMEIFFVIITHNNDNSYPYSGMT